ncbi:glycosyltransferase family 2 protein [Microvirga makkahensis]|uniref:Glycosyltransferase n=1 Tax=Microvirga makkahensis TaxID=1128670 RepID=A0A7X3MVH4_9HYPH|nr:glycosyltransferase family 2 protein [Microvirga makkahensis]MXQ13735.1 glycosyltransferase [Microvirga makkahensis]
MLDMTLGALAALVCFPSLILAAEVLAASALKSPVSRTWRPGRFLGPGTIAVIVPAHNEEAGIRQTLQDIAAQLRPCDRLLVVADNCTDDTAAVARAAGAEVSERQDPERRGKGYALDWGLRHLRQDPPETVVIIDADCRVAPGSILPLAQTAFAAGRPTQALYVMKSAREGQRRRVQELAWMLKNHVRPLGLARLGLPCQLMGTGMAFPWQPLAAVDLASGHLVEDVKLGLDLAARGRAALFYPAAYVESTFPASETGIITQRQRWEIGSTRTLVQEAPRALWRGLRTGNRDLLALALDLLVPPLSLLSAVVGLVWLACAAAALVGYGLMPLLLATIAGLLTAGSLTLAWARFGRRILGVRDLPELAGHLMQKVRIYRRLGHLPEWIRTDRSRG